MRVVPKNGICRISGVLMRMGELWIMTCSPERKHIGIVVICVCIMGQETDEGEKIPVVNPRFSSKEVLSKWLDPCSDAKLRERFTFRETEKA
jgi:hypothetical protein